MAAEESRNPRDDDCLHLDFAVGIS
jgi:hypothetical protein